MLPVILKQHSLVDDLAKNSVLLEPNQLKYYHNLLDYMCDNIELDIYTVHTLKKAIQSSSINDVCEIVRFFSGGNSNLFKIIMKMRIVKKFTSIKMNILIIP